MYKEISENLFLIYVDMPESPLRNLNAYFIRGDERDLLIDTGELKEASYRSLMSGLTELKADMSRTDIFLTHLHNDHIGLVEKIAAEGTKVYMGRRDVNHKFRMLSASPERKRQYIHAELEDFGFPPEYQEKLTDYELKNYFTDTFRDFISVDEGDIFNCASYHLEAIDTPGHTPGHMCLYDRDKQLMFCGDHVLFDITPNISAWDGHPDSLGDYLSSLEKIKKYPTKLVLPAHRGVDKSLEARADELIAHHRVRLLETEEILKTHPGVTAYELAGCMSWNIRYDGNWENFPLAQKPFAVNEVKAHLDYLIIRGKVASQKENNVSHYYYINSGESV